MVHAIHFHCQWLKICFDGCFIKISFLSFELIQITDHTYFCLHKKRVSVRHSLLNLTCVNY